MDLIIIFFAKYFIFLIIIVVGLYLLRVHGNTKHFYRISFIIFSSALFAWIFAHVLKDIIKHPRPDQIMSLIQDSGTYSFPSGHTTFIATLGYSLLNFGKDGKNFAYTVIGLALIVGFARVLAGVHYWYDIVGGFILGIAIAFVLGKIIKKFIK